MTAPRFRKKADKDLVVIPGVGRVAPGQVLVGMEYKRFAVLGLLEEIPEITEIMKPKVVTPPVVEEPAPQPSEPKPQPTTAGKGVELPDTSDIEDPDLRQGWERGEGSDDENGDENDEQTETEADQEVKLKKRAEIRRRKGAKK